MTDRRSEPRYRVKEEGLLWDLHSMKAGCHSATIGDISRNGMRIEAVREFKRGGHVGVDFRGMIVCGTIQYCRRVQDRFIIGIRINNVLDPLNIERDDDTETGLTEVQDVAPVV